VAVTSSQSNTVAILLNTSPAPSTADPIATALTLTTDANPAVTGQPITLTATVTSADGSTPVGSVTFFDGATVLGVVAVDPNGQAVLIVPFGVGVHSLHASFAGIAPFTASTSATVSETVNPDATTTSLAAEVLGIGSTGATVSFTATVTPAPPGAGTLSGTITLFDGDTIVGTAQVAGNGQGFFLISLPLGAHSLTASYSGDASFLASISDVLELTL
jgi:hypothetical protein